MSPSLFRLAIVGAGRGGTALLQVLQEDGNIELVGIVDARNDAPALAMAAARAIPVFDAITSLPACDMVINVTGSAEVSAQLRQYFDADVEIMEGKAAYFFYDQICKRKREKEQSERLLAEFEKLNRIGHRLNATDELDEMLNLVLEEAMQVTGSPAGTISLYDKATRALSLYSARGFSTGFEKQEPWIIREGGLTERILSERQPFVVPRVTDSDQFTLNSLLADEGVEALVAVPLALGHENVGILYVNDFRAREYDEDQVCILDLLANQAAHAIQKARLFNTIRREKAELKSLNEHLEARVMDRTRELTRANEELVRASQAKSQFLSNMSHELRTPLTSINGFSEFLLDGYVGPLNEAQSRYLTNINVSGKHLLELINGILDLSKIEAGKSSLKPELVDVGRLLDEVMLVLEGYANKAMVRLKLQCADEIPDLLLDRTKFKQILYNLCSNAIKFSPEGGEVTVTVAYDKASFISGREEQYATLSVAVRDQGIGISPEDQATIFNPFEQADGSHTRHFEGTGLGLTLTKRLVEMHGGRIELESAVGEGSCFSFVVPVETEQVAAETREGNVPVEAAAELLSCDKPLPQVADAPLILVVDDDAASLEISTLYLSEAGYRVCHARNGDAALDVARKKRPFLILLDVMMPGKDGWEVLQELKLDADTADIPVIMCTVSENEELGVALGATDYLTKPIDRRQLVSRLGTLFQGRRQQHRTTHVLAIDDDEQVRELYAATLGAQGYRVHTAANGPDGLRMAAELEPDMILLDLMMPGMDGFETAEKLKQQPRTREIPIIVVSAKELTMGDRMRLVGHIEKCVSKASFTREQLLGEIRQFEVLYPQQAGLHDSVSGLLNHRYFQIRLTQEIARSQRNDKSLACVIFDLDGFGKYSELVGEAYVHAALRKVGDILIGNLRASDIATRHRIDEFAMILTETELEAALLVAHRIKGMIESYPFPGEEKLEGESLTACVAVAAFPDHGATAEELMSHCHELIRTTKTEGSNRLGYRQNGEVMIK